MGRRRSVFQKQLKETAQKSLPGSKVSAWRNIKKPILGGSKGLRFPKYHEAIHTWCYWLFAICIDTSLQLYWSYHLPTGFVDPRALNSSRKRFRITTAFIPLCFEARIWYKYAKCPGPSIFWQQKPSTELHETHRLLGTTLKKLHHCLWVGLGGKVAVSSYPVSKTMGLSFYHPLLETPNW